MLLRIAVLVLGLAEVLRPRRLVDFWMNLATDGDGSPRRWVYAAARVEGLLLVLWALRRRDSSS
ncbi:hypothetical protein ACFR97_11695 [Haloplanus litoreus]|uniref:Uncharacterized protein n=1 Tax=Haloplanus litoreus TaxID=767515 RepID=A0ABD5ZZP3_9EURY